MDLGTGLFLGLFFIGLIWLYIATLQRWRWKRIATFAIAIILISSVSLIAWSEINKYLESRPQVEEQLWDLKPLMTMNEVLFRKGEPIHKYKDGWLWEYGSLAYVVRFDDGRIWAIEVHAMSNEKPDLPSIQGINHTSTQEDIERRFGKPDNVSNDKNHTRRQINYLEYGVTFQLERNRVISVGVIDGKKPVRFAEEGRGT